MPSNHHDSKGEFKNASSNQDSAGTFLGRIIPWKPKCCKKKAKLLTASSQSDSISHAPYGPIQQYGQFNTTPSHNSAWNSHTAAVKGQVSYHQPSQQGTTRVYQGQITTNIHGIEHFMPTNQYLSYNDEQRNQIIHPPGLRLETGYGVGVKPMDPPPDAPPPPPPIDTKTGKAFPVRVQIEAALSEAEDKDGDEHKERQEHKEHKKCPQCHHVGNPAVNEGVWICSGCYQGHKFMLANVCEKH